MNTGIYKGDCLDFIDELNDFSIDVCITDPPYGISYQSNRRKDKEQYKAKILNDEKPFIEWIKPLFHKMKEGGRLVCFYRWDVQDEFLTALKDAGFTVKSQIVWDKVIHGMGDLHGEFAPMHELMLYATKGRYLFENKRPKTVYRSKRINGSELIHPNEKPISLIAALIRDISNKNDLILDPFGGSFSTYRAAIQEGRKCISFELHDEYFEVGRKIVNQGTAVSLFSLV
jgi:DNA modification methylase